MVAVTGRDDMGADLVVLECERRGIEIYRFNSEDFPAPIGIYIAPTGGRVELLDPRIGWVSLSAARGIWIRRPQWPAYDPAIEDEADRRLAFQESVATLAGAWRLLADRCVSPADSLQAARWKLPQLRLARKVGFQVPETLVTTSPSEARAFIDAGRTVVKAVAEARVRSGDIERVGSVREITADAPLDDVAFAPTMFQRLVPKVADVRVTVIGDRAFSVRIGVPEGSPLDFRDTEAGACSYDVYDLAQSDLDKAMLFLRHHGLLFGAFDFGLTGSGELIFFECNPNGQWGWLENRTGLPMTAELVTLLANRSSGVA